MCAQFFHLGPKDSTRHLAEWHHDKMELERILCPIDEGHRRGGKRLTDLSITLPGAGVQDIVWTWYSELLIQDHVHEYLQKHTITGYELKPVTARFEKSDAPPPRLWEVVVTGWGGMASSQSGIRLEISCSGCGYMQYSGATDASQIIDAAQWDGSDLFIVWPLPRFIFLSPVAAKLLKAAHFSGAIIRPATSLSGIGKSGISPGRLSWKMPEERARELGKPLGIY